MKKQDSAQFELDKNSEVDSNIIDEDELDDDGEEKSENIDPKFRQNRPVNIIFTLPSGGEEIILDYNMCFADK